MTTPDIPQPSPDQLISNPSTEIEKIGAKVIDSLRQRPPTPRLDAADDFWSNPTILAAGGVTYGQGQDVMSQTNEWGSTTIYRRPILDESGQRLGEWVKKGHYLPRYFPVHSSQYMTFNKGGAPNNTIQAVWFEEEVRLKDQQQRRARVYLDRNTGRVSAFEMQDGDRLEQLNYSYDDSGEINKIEYVQKDTNTKGILTSREIFRKTTPIKAESSIQHQPPQKSIPQLPDAKPKQGFLRRLFRK